ncbi:NAD-dependent epimerase/dehydratase family protein [Amphritea balenae]|uniref:NAD-dependent epimerase/dehydratase family protein n=1 Tax=Amphritea balenae TaxID=452629 RepID=A0A3P1STX9_9GAMM|nr:NAD-dependent epimerase/dehydratase family protein [Amphritea balenae]RRD00540.1 NAD-dependent epimerase/dehydratase family protein [Amphritea balenae]GGK69887.1 epimerase [Amphritea balenae]
MNWSDKTCLITGGASFIGSHLTENLVSLGAKVRVVDNLSSGKKEYITSVADKIEFIEADLLNLGIAKQVMNGVDRVFHLAADHGGRGYIAANPANCSSNMALDSIVFKAAAEAEIEHVTFTSSACVYPTDIQEQKLLLTEDLVSFEKRGGAFADEEYGWAKLMGELSLKAHYKQHGMKAAIARLSTVYGPRENESHALVALVAKAFIKQSPFDIWGDGNQTRGFTYVSDIVNGLILASENINDASAVNLGTDEFISLNRIASIIFEQTGWSPFEGVKHQLDKPVGVVHRALDYSHTQAQTGWRPLMSLEQGIAETIEWYFANNDVNNIKQNFESRLLAR